MLTVSGVPSLIYWGVARDSELSPFEVTGRTPCCHSLLLKGPQARSGVATPFSGSVSRGLEANAPRGPAGVKEPAARTIPAAMA